MTETVTTEAGGRPTAAARPPRRTWLDASAVGRALTPLLWIGPALVLIGAIVLWPAVEMVMTSMKEITSTGLSKRWVGFDNYEAVLNEPALVPVLLRTVVWVVGVVVVTMALGLALAQLLNARFPGRKLVRWALIVPWAASVVMTAIAWRWILDFFYGIFNRIGTDLGLIEGPQDWLGEPGWAFVWLMWVAVFVSLPFTTYVILAGLQTVPGDVYEAAQIDGASRWRTYWSIVFPLLRPALLVATVINVINVFNSFPIIWAMTQGGPGYDTDTTTTFMYKLAKLDKEIGMSASMAVMNFVMIIVMVLFYLKAVRWKEVD